MQRWMGMYHTALGWWLLWHSTPLSFTQHIVLEELQIAISVFQNCRFDEGVANSALFSELIFATTLTQDKAKRELDLRVSMRY